MCCSGGIISPNKNVKIQRAGDSSFKVTSSLEETDIPVEYQSLFGDVKTLSPSDIYYVLEFKDLIPSDLGPITVIQDNEALSIYENIDSNVEKVEDAGFDMWRKTKIYDGTDNDYAILVTQPANANYQGLDIIIAVKDQNSKYSKTYTIIPWKAE